MTKRESLVLVLAGSLATSGIGRFEEHKARAERLVDEALKEHAHELAKKIRTDADEWDGWPEKQTAMGYTADLIDPEVSSA
ncbi:hypothetical protein [Streptomyces scabiei]|uniref:hypothetical protein n=1 Tax=Streptomyces scabiei TaxID=1930 RepID=UPI0029A8EFE7|nr:hypothetical protein [Streptomyces scabiei]MDX2794022.1 hypothetical protein [Streptomyces scabiei]